MELYVIMPPPDLQRHFGRTKSEAEIWLARGFELKRNPGANQNDRLASLCERLVEETLGVPERARKRVFGHDAATGLVRDEDNRSGQTGDALRQFLRCGGKIIVLQEKVAKPKRRAINNDNTICACLAAERLGKGDGLFHKHPARVACGGVAGDAQGHFGVFSFRRRDQYGLQARGFREPLCDAAFARPRAAENKNAFRWNFDALHIGGPDGPEVRSRRQLSGCIRSWRIPLSMLS